MNVTACLLVLLVLVPVATNPASAADARASAHERRPGARYQSTVAPPRDTTSVIGAGHVGQTGLPTPRRVHRPPVDLEKPAPAGAQGSASLNGTAIRVTTHAGIDGTKIRPPTSSLNGASIGARR